MSGETTVTEGKATLYFASKKGVFYNPPQIPNRDLSVLSLQEFAEMWAREPLKLKPLGGRTLRQGLAAPGGSGAGAASTDAAAAAEPAADADAEPAEGEAPAAEVSASATAPARPGLRVLDALSASGLRAMRYSLEVPSLREVVANDVDPVAVATMRNNFERNGLSEPAVVSHVGDACALLYGSRPPSGERFDVVDLDPYGTAAPFLDSAVQAVSDGGMLMVTCTDMAVLAGAYPEACYAKYGAYSLKGKHCHEQGLRILLGCIDSHAARHGRYITPLLSVHINFYVRVFVRVQTGKAAVKLSPTKVSYLYQCSGCDAFALQPVAKVTDKESHEKVTPGTGPPVNRHCEHCGRVHHVGGPLWTAPIHDTPFVEALLGRLTSEGGEAFGAQKRLVGMLTSVLEEVPDAPLFTNLAQMCSTLHLPCPQIGQVLSALVRQGFRVSRSHTDPMAIKTDAPLVKVWDVLRSWAATDACKKQQGERKTEVSATSPAAAILATPPGVTADFRPMPEIQRMLSKKDGCGGNIGKFMPNPASWGPGSRGTAHAAFASDAPAPAAECEAEAEGDAARPLDKRAANQGKRAKKRAAREAAAGEEGESGEPPRRKKHNKWAPKPE